MKTLFVSGSHAQRHLLRLIRDCERFSCAVAWATRSPVSDAIEKNVTKGNCLVIGTHLYQTCPDVLERLQGYACVVPPTGALFHPKVYVFETATGIAALVGSHNLTGAAFGRNIEASVLLTGTTADRTLRDLSAFVSKAWDGAETITDEFLFSYRRQHAAKKESRERLKEFVRIRPPRGHGGQTPVLDLSWREFVRGVSADKYHSLKGRLDLLHQARALFEKHGSLERMKVEDRRRIAGTEGDRARETGPFDWGWFGAMGGFGQFAHLVNQKPAGISRALDAIPLRGPVTAAHYGTFVRRFAAAFRDSDRKGSISSGTRLLAIKRPDLFVCFNSKNRAPLCERLGSPASRVNLATYWESVIQPIQASRWWNHPEPEPKRESAIWHGRAALLDAMYYAPDAEA